MNRAINEVLAARVSEKPALISHQARELLNLRRLPAMLNMAQTAVLLGLAEHDIPVLARAGLLQPLGNPPANAVKHFAKYRMITNGRMTAHGLDDYLVLLSIYQTCVYRGVSFLQFLLSGSRDLDKFCESQKRKREVK